MSDAPLSEQPSLAASGEGEPEVVLDRLQGLLRRQLELVHQGRLAAAVDLFDETDRCVRQIGGSRTGLGVDPEQLGAGRVRQGLQQRKLRLDAEGDGGGVPVGELQLVGGVDFGIQLDGLHRRAFEAHGLGAVAGLAAGGLHLQGAGQRVRVVLQRNDAQHTCRLGINQHNATFEDLG